jgi:hypothetical protein
VLFSIRKHIFDIIKIKKKNENENENKNKNRYELYTFTSKRIKLRWLIDF